jgi:hypothetical protein
MALEFVISYSKVYIWAFELGLGYDTDEFSV